MWSVLEIHLMQFLWEAFAFLSRRSTSSQQSSSEKKPSPVQVELLEDRIALTTHALEPHLLFAPGTSQSYIDQFRHADEGTSISEFRLDDRWVSTATNGSGGAGAQGNPVTVTWSIVPDGTNINGFAGEATSASNLVQTFRGIYGITHNASDTNYQGEAWFEVIEASFDRLSELSGINYVYESSDDGSNFAYNAGTLGVRGDVRIGGHRIDGNGGTLAYNFFPDTSDMVIDTADSFYNNIGSNSIRLRNVIMHEAGHGLGLSHVESNNAAFLMEPFINTSFNGPQLDDILGLHRGYGDINEAGNGNDTASRATSLGTIGSGQSVQIGEDATDTVVASTDTDFVSIDDNSDIDYYSFTVGANSVVDITLAPLGPTYNEGAQGGSQSSFNTKSQSDLTLQLISSNGSTVLATANSTGLGGTESLSNFSLPGSGTFYVRISGANNAAQFYQLDIAVSVNNPEPGVTIVQSGGSTSVSEDGATDTYTIVLDSQPIADVTVSINSGSQLSTGLSSVVFTNANWNQARTVTVSAVDDNEVEGNHNGTVSHSASSDDSAYDGISVANVTASITDNDSNPEPGVTIVQSGGSSSVSEGGATDTYTIVLDSQPIADVTVSINSGSQLSTGLSSVVFTNANWNQARTVTVSAVDDNEVEGNHNGTVSHSVSSDDSAYDGISVANVTASITDNDSSSAPNELYFSLQSGTTAGTLTIQDEDIAIYNKSTNSYSLLFDGSDVGLSGLRIDAFDVISSTEILLSFDQPSGNVDDSDIILFKATSLGSTTSGSFFWYFDASDVGLTSGGGFFGAFSDVDDVDAVTLLSDGSLLLSTLGNLSINGLSVSDEDIIRFVPTALGSTTKGSFQMFLDGSTVGLSQSSGEDIDGLAVDGGKLYLTTLGNFSVSGVSGADDDVFVFNKETGKYDSNLFVNFTSNDLKGLDFAGKASTTGLGLTSSVFVGDVVFELTPVSFGLEAPETRITVPSVASTVVSPGNPAIPQASADVATFAPVANRALTPMATTTGGVAQSVATLPTVPSIGAQPQPGAALLMSSSIISGSNSNGLEQEAEEKNAPATEATSEEQSGTKAPAKQETIEELEQRELDAFFEQVENAILLKQELTNENEVELPSLMPLAPGSSEEDTALPEMATVAIAIGAMSHSLAPVDRADRKRPAVK